MSETETTVGETAALVGISVRTLHHYDQIGLVVPSRRSPAGYRLYAEPDVERLLQVLTYRELGFPLEQIATLLDDPDANPMTHLQRQHELLQQRITHLQRMVAAVEELMNRKRSGINLTAADMAEVFGDDWPGDESSAEAEQRWGDTDAWQQSQRAAAKLTKQDWQDLKDDGEAFEAELTAAMTRGVLPGSDEANALAEAHRARINAFYDCDHAMQICLAEMYLADDRFTRHYDDRAPGLAQWLHDIITANAAQQGS